MGNFSRALQHLDMKDVKRKRLKEIAAQKLKEQADAYEKKVIQEISKKYKSDWKREIYEGMTTANALTQTLPASDLENVINDTPTTSADVFADGPARFSTEDNFSYDAMVGTNIKSSGSGSGSDGGFNIGDHVAFDGTGSTDGARWCILKAADTTKVDFMVIRAIVGNGSNGGETPDDTYEGLMLYYKTSDMDDYIPITYYPSLLNANFKGGNQTIIPVNIGSYGDTLRDYYAPIPDYARTKDTRFLLYQFQSTAANRDTYGITNISYRRLTPINVVVPLDDPEAVSFVRVGSDEGDPKKRKKKLNDQLAASDEYTKTVLGNQFPGQGARIDGEDPFRSAPLTPDDVIDASPIGKGEVKKSFSSFSADTAGATATSEPEPTESEPTTPSTQTTMNPTNDEGEEITVKTLGGKNSGIIQGADAAAVDAQNDQDDAQDITPDPEEPEIPDPEEIKPEPSEVKGKTPKEQNQLEIDKKQGVLDSELSKLQNQLNNTAKDMAGFLNVLNLVAGPLQTVLNLAGSISSLVSRITGKDKPGWMVTKDNVFGKLNNNISIARSQLTGKVVNGNLNMQEYDQFVDGITLGDFVDGALVGKPNLGGAMINISSKRHEYQDDNIYVKDGKIYNNREENATNLTAAHNGLSHHGNGYAQMIIPPDGSEPYVHYYDYGYNNLNNPDDIGGKGLSLAITSFFSDLSLFLSSVPGVGGSLADAFNKDEWMEGLRNTSSMEGWPPGIHGAVLIDFKVPVSKLNSEVKEMIANHPLSWTPERIANMKEQDWIDELTNRIGPEDYENYEETLLAAMKDPDTGSTVDPEFLEKYQRYYPYSEYDEKTGNHPDAVKGTVQYDYDKAVEELRKAQDNPDYDKATQAAYKEYEDIIAERDKKYAEVGEKYDTGELWERYVGPYYRAVMRMINSGNSVGDENPTFRKMTKGYEEYRKQEKIYGNKRESERRTIMDEYGKLKDEAYAKYESTFKVIKLDDGTMGMVNGGDFKTKDGKVIPGKRTLTAKEQARFDEVRAEYDEVQKYLYSNEDYLDNMYIPYVLYDVRAKFGNSVSGEDWSPEKKGSGERSQNEPKPDSGSGYGSGYAGVNEPFFGGGNRKDDEEKIAANYNDFVDPLDKMIKKLEKKNKNLPWPKPDPDDPFEFSRGHRTSSYELKGNSLLEKYAKPKPKRDLFERLKQKQFFNPKDIKPTFPENPPPQLDPKTGMHPNYGKHAKRYRKLDPASANAMPPTGDPETDAVVDKQRTKPKTKLYDRLKKNIRKDLTNK